MNCSGCRQPVEGRGFFEVGGHLIDGTAKEASKYGEMTGAWCRPCYLKPLHEEGEAGRAIKRQMRGR